MKNYIIVAADDAALPRCRVRSRFDELCSFIKAALSDVCRFDDTGCVDITIDDTADGIIVRSSSSESEVTLERPLSAAAIAEAVSALSSRKTPIGFSADKESLSAVFGDTSVKLTATEFRLFSAILENGGSFVSADALSMSVWGKIDRNLCTVYLSYLRQKLDKTFGDGTLISARGKGYRLRAPDHKL